MDCSNQVVESTESEKLNSHKPKKKSSVQKLCCVAECSARNARSFHRFPKLPEMRQKWAEVCKLNRPVSDYLFVCSNHFLDTDFIPRWDRQLKRLKLIAIPSQNFPTEEKATKSIPSIIQKRKANKKPTAKAKKSCTERPSDSQDQPPKQEIVPSPSTEDLNAPASPTVVTIQYVPETITADPLPIENGTDSVEDEQFEEYIQENSPVKENIEQQYYTRMICKCTKNTEFVVNEVTASKVLMELNEIGHNQTENNHMLLGTKDIMLKVVEEFYFALRRHRTVTVTSFIKSDHQVFSFTGIGGKLLDIITRAVLVYLLGERMKFELGVKNQIILCLMRLRLNLSFQSISTLFCTTETECREIFYTNIPRLKSILSSAIYWPTKAEVKSIKPQSWQLYKKTIAIVDSTQLEVEPESHCRKCGMLEQSNYMCGEKFKILLGVSEYGVITFVSKATSGPASNQTNTDPDFISKVLVPSGNAIMNHGFIEEKSNRVFIQLIKLRTVKPFYPEIALHIRTENDNETPIEKALKRLSAFKILQKHISLDTVPFIDDISVIVAGIVNVRNSLLAELDFTKS